MAVWLDLDKVALLFQIGNNLLARFIAVESLIFSAEFIDNALVIQHADDLQIVTQTDFKVVRIMRRCHLDATGTEVHFSVIIGNDGNFFIHKRQNHILADDIPVALIVRIDANAAVTEHRLRTGRSDDNLSRSVCQGITDMPQMTGLIHILNLRVGQCRYAMRTPVDNTASFINQPLFIQVDKHFTNRRRAALVHRKTGALPVTGSAELLLLLDNAVAVLALPVPDLFQKFFAAKIITRNAVLTQNLFNLDLRSNTGMIHAGNPQSGITLHPLETNQNVLKRRVHRMTHVKLTGNVGRGHYNGKRLFIRISFGVKVSAVVPELINPGFHILRIIDFR